MCDKELFQDKRWTQNPGGIITGKVDITEDDKKWAEELHKQIIEENSKNT